MLRSSVRACSTAVCAVLLPLLIAACGADESAKLPTQVLQDASTATKAVSTYHVYGTGATSTSSFDLHIGGPDAVSGTLTESGVTAGVIIAKGAGYLKGKAYLEQAASPQIASLVGDSWLKLPASSAADLAQSFVAITNTKQLAGCLVTGLNGLTLEKSTGTVNGQPVVVVQAGALSLSFASSGPTYLVRVKSTAAVPSFDDCLNGTTGSSSSSQPATSGGTVNFDSWGSSVSVTPPPNPVNLAGG
ncbi:MAG: hypothetical protein JOZ75_03265 [Candidatus Dormibacteraeota bacterium]|nr:hypothetical protein [Candidatus Dormibacteraeota bacterium]